MQHSAEPKVDALTSLVKKAFSDSSDASTRQIGLTMLKLMKEIEDYEAQGYVCYNSEVELRTDFFLTSNFLNVFSSNFLK